MHAARVRAAAHARTRSPTPHARGAWTRKKGLRLRVPPGHCSAHIGNIPLYYFAADATLRHIIMLPPPLAPLMACVATRPHTHATHQLPLPARALSLPLLPRRLRCCIITHTRGPLTKIIDAAAPALRPRFLHTVPSTFLTRARAPPGCCRETVFGSAYCRGVGSVHCDRALFFSRREGVQASASFSIQVKLGFTYYGCLFARARATSRLP